MAVDYSKLSILIVEDDNFTRGLIRKVLKEIGVRSILESSNGKDGLMEVVRTRPDIVFCDIHMAPMNGKQFLQGVRGIKVKDVDKTPVIFLTGDSDLSTVRFAKEHNVNGYLVKPISLAKLRDSIDAVVSSNVGMTQWLT
ncbi:response regulator [Azospirillum formosense]|uniref:response regulator n=1 Tax=Azospirillum formosense TaxID=861533 RepID=UPI00338FE863